MDLGDGRIDRLGEGLALRCRERRIKGDVFSRMQRGGADDGPGLEGFAAAQFDVTTMTILRDRDDFSPISGGCLEGLGHGCRQLGQPQFNLAGWGCRLFVCQGFTLGPSVLAKDMQ